ncbi:MAG: FG-GAP repeat domain-containing protein [Armatimonadota bacterium]
MKSLLLQIGLCFALPAVPADTPKQTTHVRFEHVIIDRDVPEGLDCKGVGDIDGDRFTDIVVAGNLRGGSLVWYRYPNWAKHVIDVGQFAVDMQVGDVDRDGDLDIIVSEAYEAPSKGKALLWYENPRPKGSPAADKWKRHVITANAPVDSYIHDIEVGDLNRDRKLDVVIRHGKTVLYLQNTPDSWAERIIDEGSGSGDEEGTALGDINRDGRLDVVLNGYWLEQPPDPIKGTWRRHIIDSNWPQLVGVAVADINRDGRPDVLLAPAEDRGRLSWYEAPKNPPSDKWIEHVIDSDVEYIHTFKVADMNLDRWPDVVTAEMAQSGYHPDKPSRKRVSVYLNQGKGVKWRHQIVANTGSHNIRVADIDSDRDIDIVGANWGGAYHPVELWRNLLNSPKSRSRLPR